MEGTISFEALVKQALYFAREKHPRPYTSTHQALGILWEEFEEFKAEVFKQRAERDPARMLEELIQVAAVCQRAAEDLNLLEE